MQLLEDRINKDGIVKEGNVLKVDSFLNHQMDIELYNEIGKEFRSLIANAESLDALLEVKRRFSAYLLPEENKDPKFRAIAWQSLLWAIWGPSSENGGSKAIKTAPKELKEKYQQVFA